MKSPHSLFLLTRSLLHVCSFLIGLSCVVSASPPTSGGSFVETTKSYRPSDRSVVGSLNERERQATAWRGERVNWQILLWTGDEAAQAEMSSSDLVGSDGQRIPAQQVRLDFLKFIEMNTHDRYATDPALVEHVPDMLNGSTPTTIKAGEIQPLWVGIDIPRDAQVGTYKGEIQVKLGSDTHQFPFKIKVLPVTIPEVKDWKLNVNFWMHPQATAHYYAGCKGHGQDASKWTHHGCAELMWSDQHLAWYKPTLELLRDAGQKNITVNLMKDPWRSAYKLNWEQQQTNYSYDEMIHWRRDADGNFHFDFSHFEKYVRFCMEIGIDQQIECFSMLPWISSKISAVSCYDEATQKEIIYHFKDWADYERVWSSFMQEFVPVLVKNGWFNKTRIGVDERGLHNIPHVHKVLEKFKYKGNTLRISSAANRVHDFDDKVDSISMHGGTEKIVNDKWTEQQFAEWTRLRREKGLQSTWYTCTFTYPGHFGNSRPAESLFIGWYSARIQADGYLRWAVDSWNDEPTKTTDHKVHETGDSFQLYPGDRDAKVPFTRSSVRFELFRQGVVDYEKIQLLKEKSPQSRNAIAAMLEKVERPAMPPRINGNSSLKYEKSTEYDFSNILKTVQQELLEITLEAIKSKRNRSRN